MTAFSSTLWSEMLKVYRSRVFWITILFFVFIPFMMGVIMFVVIHPEFAGKLGLVGSKAAILRFGNVDWQTYLGLLDQMFGGVGVFGFGFVASWIFGREYSDRTAKDLLALPVPRSSIVMAKFVVVAIWCIILSVIILLFGIITGAMIHLSGWSSEMAIQHVCIFMFLSLLSLFLCTPPAFFASLGRGYLTPIGFILLTLILAQFVGLVNIAPYFPWAVPLLLIGGGGTEGEQLGFISYLLLIIVSLLGLVGTLAWWRYADQF